MTGNCAAVRNARILRGGNQRSLAWAEVVEDFDGVALGFDDGPDGLDHSRFADEKRTPDDAHEFAAHEGFLLPRAKGFDGFMIWIAEQ
jgi:hypothetical protein